MIKICMESTRSGGLWKQTPPGCHSPMFTLLLTINFSSANSSLC